MDRNARRAQRKIERTERAKVATYTGHLAPFRKFAQRAQTFEEVAEYLCERARSTSAILNGLGNTHVKNGYLVIGGKATSIPAGTVYPGELRRKVWDKIKSNQDHGLNADELSFIEQRVRWWEIGDVYEKRCVAENKDPKVYAPALMISDLMLKDFGGDKEKVTGESVISELDKVSRVGGQIVYGETRIISPEGADLKSIKPAVFKYLLGPSHTERIEKTHPSIRTIENEDIFNGTAGGVSERTGISPEMIAAERVRRLRNPAMKDSISKSIARMALDRFSVAKEKESYTEELTRKRENLRWLGNILQSLERVRGHVNQYTVISDMFKQDTFLFFKHLHYEIHHKIHVSPLIDNLSEVPSIDRFIKEFRTFGNRKFGKTSEDTEQWGRITAKYSGKINDINRDKECDCFEFFIHVLETHGLLVEAYLRKDGEALEKGIHASFPDRAKY